MRTTSKIVLVIVIITLVYSVVKLINASTPQEQTIATITWTEKQPSKSTQNNQANKAPTTANTAQNTNQNTQAVYQADEVLIDGQGVAGANYVDITSNTPITPQQIAQAKNTQKEQNAQNNSGTYAEEININNNAASTKAQNYAPGMPAFEVIDGN